MDINRTPILRPVLMEVGPEYFKRIADYAACREVTNTEIKKIANDSELDLYSLLMGNGAIPADSKITPAKNFAPRRPVPTSK